MKRIGTIAAVAGTLMLTFGVGTAAGVPPCDNVSSCFEGTGPFPGGTISIDVDALRLGSVNETLQWSLQGVPGCTTTFRADDPPRSWVCNNVPAGSYTLAAWTGSFARYNWDIGVRW